MNAIREDAFLFGPTDAPRMGIVATPSSGPDGRSIAAPLGVLVVVGGPQYRVGSHRQFVLLSRRLAAAGFAVMRFDCSGMGDSAGPERPFTERNDDIAGAIDAFLAHVPSLDGVVIWGLCDAASAALLYAPTDTRVRHLVLLNPWVRSGAGLARTQLKHYYTSRLLDRAFWSNLLRGRVALFRSIAGFVGTLLAARGRHPASNADVDYQTRMAHGWRQFRGDILLLCSGDDLTAREFGDHVARDTAWSGLLAQPRVTRSDHADADHTFSRAEWRDRVADETVAWLETRSERPDADHPASSRMALGVAA